MTFLVRKQCQGIQHRVVYVHLNEYLCPFQPSHGTYDIEIPPQNPRNLASRRLIVLSLVPALW